MVYRLDTPGVEDLAIKNEKIGSGAVSTAKADSSINNALVPINGIIMYSGTEDNIPANWSLCDGSNGTPNLVNKFIIAAASYDDTVTPSGSDSGWRTSVEGTNEASGGSSTKTLASTELPSHTHGITDPGHQHTTSVDTGRLFHQGGQGNTINYGGPGQYPGTVFSMDDANTGITSTDGQSGTTGEAFDILPPYYAIAYIMRVS